MRLLIVSVVPAVMLLELPPPVAATLLAVNAPPAGAVESDCAVNDVAVLVSPALFEAVTDDVPVGDAAVNVKAPAAFAQPDPAIAP